MDNKDTKNELVIMPSGLLSEIKLIFSKLPVSAFGQTSGDQYIAFRQALTQCQVVPNNECSDDSKKQKDSVADGV